MHNQKRVILYGAGSLGKFVFYKLKDKYNIIGFGDSDLKKKNSYFCGKLVLGDTRDLLNQNIDLFIITTFPGRQDVLACLLNNHYPRQILFSEYDSENNTVSFFRCPSLPDNSLISFNFDYSTFEDVELFHMLSSVNSPIRYIDAGANHPVYGSVTKIFYDRGGYGINIEPQHKYASLYNHYRSRDIVIESGVSDKSETIVLYGEGGEASFLSDSNLVDRTIKTTVNVQTINEIIEKNQINPIHFLKIDCEGWEKRCLLGCNFKKYRPWIICIESTIPGSLIPCYEEWEYILLENEYLFVGQIEVNRFYIDKTIRQSIKPFISRAELMKVYSVHNVIDIEQQSKKLSEDDFCSMYNG